MKLGIKDFCIRCGLCVDLYPELFEFNFTDDCMVIKYNEIPENMIEKAKDAMRDCAIAAIHVRK